MERDNPGMVIMW